MKLWAYLINGTPINMATAHVDSSIVTMPFIASDTEPTPTGTYQDVSSITNWKEFGDQTGLDYKCLRKEIKIIANVTTGWANLTNAEKLIASQWFAVGKTERTEMYPIDTQILHGRVFHRNSVDSRHARRIAAETEVYARLDVRADRFDLMSEVGQLLHQYEFFGVEGTLEGDVEALFDHLDSRQGTAYFDAGLRFKGYAIDGMNANELADRLLDILKNGNY